MRKYDVLYDGISRQWNVIVRLTPVSHWSIYAIPVEKSKVEAESIVEALNKSQHDLEGQ